MSKDEIECYGDPILDMIIVFSPDSMWRACGGWHYTHKAGHGRGKSFGPFDTHSDLMEHAEEAMFDDQEG